MTILFPFDVILANLSFAVSLSEAFYQIVSKCLSKVNFEIQKRPNSITALSLQSNSTPNGA